MAKETELTFATTALDTSAIDLAGKMPTLNHQGYVPDTGVNGFRVHFDYSSRFDTALMFMEMHGRRMLRVEIPDPLNSEGFDMGRLVSQEGFFIRPVGSLKDLTGELFIGSLPDGRRSELRSIVSPGALDKTSLGIKIDVIDPATGAIDPTTRIECERKSIDPGIARAVLDRFCGASVVKKAFYSLPDEPQPGVHCYLQQFVSRAHRGLALVEFEMGRAVAENFRPPSWLRNAFDVTSEPDFRTRALAVGGGMWRSVYNRLAGVAGDIGPVQSQPALPGF